MTLNQLTTKITLNKILGFLALLGVLCLIAVVIATRRPLPIVKAVSPPGVPPYSHFIAGAGIIEANSDNIKVSPQIAGVVKKIHVAVGDNVKVGDPLFTLDQQIPLADLQVKESAVLQAQTAVKEAEANLKSAKDHLDLANKLKNKQAISQDDYLTRQNNFLVNEAALTNAQAALRVAQDQHNQAKVTYDLYVIRAPIEGEVLQVTLHPGEYAPTNAFNSNASSAANTNSNATLVLLGRTHKLQVRADIDENDAWRYEKNARAVANIRGNGDIKFELTFKRLEPFVLPKVSLTGQSSERVDTRVLQPIYEFDPTHLPVYVGQQVDIFIEVIPEKLIKKGIPYTFLTGEAKTGETKNK